MKNKANAIWLICLLTISGHTTTTFDIPDQLRIKNVECKLSQVQEIFKDVAFLVAQETSKKEIHSTILEGLIILADIEKLITAEGTKKDKHNENKAIKKVVKLGF